MVSDWPQTPANRISITQIEPYGVGWWDKAFVINLKDQNAVGTKSLKEEKKVKNISLFMIS